MFSMEELWDIARTATYLGVTERTVYTKVRSGELPAVKVGRLWRVRPSDIETWLSASASSRRPNEVEHDRAAVAAEPGAIPCRSELESLLRQLADPLERRLVFVGLLTRGVEALGWPAPVVVGGHAVEYYTAGGYATVDVDLAGASEPVAQVMDSWGFRRQGRHWYDDDLRLVVEVPGSRPAPEALAHVTRVRIGRLTVHILGIEDLIVDRLAACKYWADEDSCDWARTMLAAAVDLDHVYLQRRADEEDVADRLEALRE